MLPASIAESQRLCVRFGADDVPGMPVALPILAGESSEGLFPRAERMRDAHGFTLFRQGDWLLGRASLPAGDRLESSARELYQSLLRAAEGYALVRVWNYVPEINEPSADALENYRVFCRGRSLAFEQALGPGFKRQAPAASAVGSDGDDLVIAFAAHRGNARHVENPHQIPAYEYPPVHGPRPPTFARATVLEVNHAPHAVFISGTAAIRGHVTVAPGQALPQLECTLENLREISRACGLGADLAAGRGVVRHIKVYLRHADDLPLVRPRLEAAFVRPGDSVSYLRSDICRRELDLEIEVSIPCLPSGS